MLGSLNSQCHGDQLKQSVPQGSVAGPILFNFYCSTITSGIDEGSEIKLGAFADDHNLRKRLYQHFLIKKRKP